MITYFLNDKYLVLKCLYDRRVYVKDEYIIKLSQQDIADILNFTKPKVNAILSELRADEYVIQVKKGKYSLTNKAIKELEILNKKGDV